MQIKSEYFKEDEFKCNCGCGLDVVDEVKFIAHGVRVDTKRPYVSTSGARCEKWNTKVGGSPTSSHPKGIADDVKFFDSNHKFEIIASLIKRGVTRIGINENKKFIHWDIDKDKPQKVLFKY